MQYAERHRLAGREKVREFLLSRLQGPTQVRYKDAMEMFDYWCHQVNESEFEYLQEESQDFIMSECLIDLESEGATIANLGDLLSAVSKRWPNRRYRTSWKVFEELKKDHPAAQAPCVPENGLFGIVMILMCWGKHAVAGALLVCFCGVMRISEALNLRISDVVLPLRPGQPRVVVLLLGQTKRGLEERVLLSHLAVVWFLLNYYWVFCQGRPEHEKFFKVSYSTVAMWLTRASFAVGLGWLLLRTHSCRRGGATALLLRGLDFPSIALYGRWASDRSCREYLRRGELALLSLRNVVRPEQWDSMDRLSGQFCYAFVIYRSFNLQQP